MIRQVDASYWKVSHVDKIPVTLVKWEVLEQERQRKAGETVLLPALKREMFPDMLPRQCAARLGSPRS